jgi:hypothetical protein
MQCVKNDIIYLFSLFNYAPSVTQTLSYQMKGDMNNEWKEEFVA